MRRGYELHVNLFPKRISFSIYLIFHNTLALKSLKRHQPYTFYFIIDTLYKAPWVFEDATISYRNSSIIKHSNRL